MNGEFPQQFKCPVCLEIPEWEIYQCQNGHTVCNICVQSLLLCPQCRLALGLTRIRNRQLEELLDMMKFDCSYKQNGCTTKLTRKQIKTHNEDCWYGGERVPLCNYLGYYCRHIVNTRRLPESITHLLLEHHCLVSEEKLMDIKLRQIDNINKTQRCLWTPIIVNAFSNHYLIVINSVEKNISFVCISFGKEPNDQVQINFRIVSPVDKVPVLEWTTKPIAQADSPVILRSPPFQFPISILSNIFREQDLTIYVNITDSNVNNVNGRRSILTLDYIPYTILPLWGNC